jgi:hypothetical protein
MWVQKKKILKITYQGKRICLKGVQPEISKCYSISASKLKGLLRRGAMSHCIQMKCRPSSLQEPDYAQELHLVTTSSDIPEVQQLLTEFDQLFQEPTVLPPSRNCDHQIPLIPGAQPGHIDMHLHRKVKLKNS